LNNIVINKAKLILDDITYGLDLAKNWHSNYFEYFYKYFSDADKETRKYALLIFAAGLGNWLSGSAAIFLSCEIESENNFIFEDYIKSFLQNRQNLAMDFPELYNHIMIVLFDLAELDKFDLITLSDEIRADLTNLLLETDKNSLKYYNYPSVLNEVGFRNS